VAKFSVPFFGSLFSSKEEKPDPGLGKVPSYSTVITEVKQEAEFKIVVLGGTGVGKSSIIRRCTQDLFTQQHVPTIGATKICAVFPANHLIGIDLFSHELKQKKYPNLPKTVRLKFWDISHYEVPYPPAIRNIAHSY